MVGLGPTIHEFRLGNSTVTASKLVDGRAKHDHDGVGEAKGGESPS